MYYNVFSKWRYFYLMANELIFVSAGSGRQLDEQTLNTLALIWSCDPKLHGPGITASQLIRYSNAQRLTYSRKIPEDAKDPEYSNSCYLHLERQLV